MHDSFHHAASGTNTVSIADSEHQLVGALTAPCLESTLKCSQMARRVIVWMFGLQPLQQHPARAVGIRGEPPGDFRPCRFQRFPACTPMAAWSLHVSMRGSYLTIVPGGREAGKKSRKALLLRRKHLLSVVVGEHGQALLPMANLAKQLQGIELECGGAQAFLGIFGHRIR